MFHDKYPEIWSPHVVFILSSPTVVGANGGKTREDQVVFKKIHLLPMIRQTYREATTSPKKRQKRTSVQMIRESKVPGLIGHSVRPSKSVVPACSCYASIKFKTKCLGPNAKIIPGLKMAWTVGKIKTKNPIKVLKVFMWRFFTGLTGGQEHCKKRQQKPLFIEMNQHICFLCAHWSQPVRQCIDREASGLSWACILCKRRKANLMPWF